MSIHLEVKLVVVTVICDQISSFFSAIARTSSSQLLHSVEVDAKDGSSSATEITSAILEVIS